MEKTFKAAQLTHNHRSLLQNIEVHVLIVRLETIFPINSLLACTSKDSRLSMSTENDRHKVFMHVYLIIDDRFFFLDMGNPKLHNKNHIGTSMADWLPGASVAASCRNPGRHPA